MSDNMNIWDAVSKTDPSHTKHVNQRGGFTAIGANYQIMSATKQFGPVGEGWGYTAGEPIFQGGTVIVPVTMWHGDRSNVFGPEYGCEKFGGDRIDTDAPKKATTDALTKLLSRLGFNADVFLGKFDDNKYVQQVNQEFRQEERNQQSEANGVELFNRIRKALRDCTDARSLETLWENQHTKNALPKMTEGQRDMLAKAYSDHMADVFQAPGPDDAQD